MSSAARFLSYSFGNAYGPNGVIGRFKLDVNTQDNLARVMLEHQQLDNVRIWTAVLSLETEQALWEALAKSDFPNTERPTAVVPDTTMCEISAVHPDLFSEQTGVFLPLAMLRESPGYKELLDIVHSVIHQIGQGDITGTQDALGKVVVSDVRLNFTESVTDI